MPLFKQLSGKHHKDGKVTKAGDFVEFPYLKKGLRDRFEPAEDETNDKPKSRVALRRDREAAERQGRTPPPEPDDAPFVYTPSHRGGGRWAVFDPNGERVHEGWLNKKTAKQVAKEFNADADAEDEKKKEAE